MILSIIRKEILLLIRDRMGLAFLLAMPIALVLIMTLLQDSTFKALENEKIDIIVVDFDQDILGNAILIALDSTDIFNVHQVKEVDSISIQNAKNRVNSGEYQMGLIIPKKATKQIRKTISTEIKKQMSGANKTGVKKNNTKKTEIEIFFDPIIKASFKQAISGSIREIIAHIQTQMVFKSYTKAIERITGKKNSNDFPLNSINISEKSTGQFSETKIPNSSEHNVPAWTVFAIFFIVIPLSGQMITERNNGTLNRLNTFPTPMFYHLLGKIIVYTSIAIFQVIVLLLIGRYILPLLDLPTLEIHNLFSIFIFSIFVGLTATSYALVIGSLAKTQHQAAIFGSISVVILAAIGGVWVPIYIMSESMQSISLISPLNWALSGYYQLILQKAQLSIILPKIVLLASFSALSLLVASFYYQKTNNS